MSISEMDSLMRRLFGSRHPDAMRAIPLATELSTDTPEVRTLAISMVLDSMNEKLGLSFQQCLDASLNKCRQLARQPLRAVSEENAAEFAPAPKRRGRKPKVVPGGNVVAFRSRAQIEQDARSAGDRAFDDFSAKIMKLYGKQSAPTCNELPPAPDNDRLRRRAKNIAFGGFLTAVSNVRGRDGERPDFECFLAAAWAKLGYAAPPMTPEQRAKQLPLPQGGRHDA